MQKQPLQENTGISSIEVMYHMLHSMTTQHQLATDGLHLHITIVVVHQTHGKYS